MMKFIKHLGIVTGALLLMAILFAVGIGWVWAGFSLVKHGHVVFGCVVFFSLLVAIITVGTYDN